MPGRPNSSNSGGASAGTPSGQVVSTSTASPSTGWVVSSAGCEVGSSAGCVAGSAS
ncbi:MAG: hypothetical protein ACYTFO_02900 [Planctomycetota bacterium]|jgi:hypothetical protein